MIREDNLLLDFQFPYLLSREAKIKRGLLFTRRETKSPRHRDFVDFLLRAHTNGGDYEKALQADSHPSG